jgi:integrase
LLTDTLVAVRGHFKKRGDRWYFWVELERDPDGKRRQLSRGGFRTRKEAEHAYAEVRDQLRLGSFVAPTKLTVASFLVDEWLPAVRASIRPGTHDLYTTIVNAYIVPRIGARRLADVTPAHLNALYATLLSEGRRQISAARPAGLSPKMVRHVHTLLHKAYADAVRWGQAARNPVDRAEPPKPRTPEMKVWDVKQLRRFIDHVETDRLGPVWLLMATTGMRRGEALGLRWSDVDLEVGRISISQTHVMVEQKVVVSEPKTAKGRRSIALDGATVAGLRALRRSQLDDRMRLGGFWTDSGLVVVREDGSPVVPQTFSATFARHGRAAGLPPIRLHDLRHSYATAALGAGVPAKIVSERLGHASIAITLDTYSHVLPNMQEQAAEQVAQLILGS